MTRKFRVDEGKDPMSLTWHSDGPLGFPEVNGYAPLHTLRFGYFMSCLLYTSPSPRDKRQSRMPSSA